MKFLLTEDEKYVTYGLGALIILIIIGIFIKPIRTIVLLIVFGFSIITLGQTAALAKLRADFFGRSNDCL